MNYATVCSGIEAPTVAWEPLGWKPQWFSEIEPFPSKVLAHHYPHVPNLGDMTRIHKTDVYKSTVGKLDVLCGGTPCQSFSIAGLRQGLKDPRGNLMLTFLSIVNQQRPRYVLWENVPGVLSSNGGKDFTAFLDGLEEIGYISDVEILDARYFGLAQRRRRVFVCAQSKEDLLSRTTPSSALTICQCLLEILANILDEVSIKSVNEPENLASISRLRDGSRRRMKLFEIATERCNFKRLRQILVEALLKFHPEVSNSDWGLGEKFGKELTLEDLLMGSPTAAPFTLTEESLKRGLDDLYEVMKLYITSTTTREITPTQIYTCLQASVLIGRLICRLSGSCPTSLSAGLSFLTLYPKLTDYARQSSRDLFSQLHGLYSWHDLIRETRRTGDVVGCLGSQQCAAAVLFERHSLSGYPPPGRKARQETAGTIEASTGRSRGAGISPGMLIPSTGNVKHCLNAGGMGRIDYETETMIVTPHTFSYQNDILGLEECDVSATIKSSCSTTDERSVAAYVAYRTAGDGSVYEEGDKTAALVTGTDRSANIITFDPSQITSKTNRSNPKEEICHTLAANSAPPVGIIPSQMAVRRLTPTECERLQGFPDGYTKIPSWSGWRKMDADETPEGCMAAGLKVRQNPKTGKWRVKDVDGPRYKALGNSMATTVVRWIGQRIQLVDALFHEDD